MHFLVVKIDEGIWEKEGMEYTPEPVWPIGLADKQIKSQH